MKIDIANFRPQDFFKSPMKFAQSGSTQAPNAFDKFAKSSNISIAATVTQVQVFQSLANTNEALDKVKAEPLFDFEKVAENVLSFVKGAINKAKSDGKETDALKQMFSDARTGITDGISAAKEELESAGGLTDDIKEGIAKSETLMFDGLDDFEEDFFNPEVKPTNNISAAAFDAYQLKQGAQFAITTQEGDEIAINFNGAFSSQSAQSLAVNDDGSEVTAQSLASVQFAFSYSVNGDINEEEQTAINDLMSQLQKVSNLFFDGDLETAFEKAKELNMDFSQLASLSLNLERQETRVNARAYQAQLPENTIAKQVEPLNQELQEAQEQAEPLALQSALPDMLAWLNQARSDNGLEDLVSYTRSFFEQLAKQRSVLNDQSD